MKKLMSKSVLLVFGALLAVSLNTSLCTKTASATLSKDEEQALWSSALNEAKGNQEYAKELFELEKETIEKHKKENGGQGRTPEQNDELIKMVYEFYGNKDQDKAMRNYFEEFQELKNKYSQNPQ